MLYSFVCRHMQVEPEFKMSFLSVHLSVKAYKPSNIKAFKTFSKLSKSLDTPLFSNLDKHF